MKKKKKILSLLLCVTIMLTNNVGSMAADLGGGNSEAETGQAMETPVPADTEEAPVPADTKELEPADEWENEEMPSPCDENGTEASQNIENDSTEQQNTENQPIGNDMLPMDEKAETTGNPEAPGEGRTKALWTSITGKNSGAVLLNWQQLNEADGYEIYRSTAADSGYQQIAVISHQAAVSYTDSKCQAGITYYYQIRGYKGAEKYEFSEPMSVYVLEAAVLSGVTSYESGVLQISWKEVKGASGYEIYRKNLTTGIFEKIAQAEGQKTKSYLDRGRKNKTAYTYKVRAYTSQNGSTGYGDESGEKSGWPIGGTVIKNTLSLESGAIEITWKKAADVYRYQLYRSTTENGTYTLLATLKSGKTKYTDTTAKQGKKYYYKVRTVNRVGGQNGYGSYSAPVMGVRLAKPVISYVKSVSAASLKLSWGKVLDADGYYIYRSAKKNGTYKKIATIKKGNTVSYTDKKVKTNTTYYYQVRAYNNKNGGEGLSKLSSKAGGKTLPKASLVKVVSKSSSSMTIAWKKVTGAAGYEIARSTSAKGTYKVVCTVKSGTKLSFTDKNLKSGKKYYYKVRAIQVKKEVQGQGSYSKVLSGKTALAAKISKIQSAAGEVIRVKWKAVSGAAGYQIYRSESLNGKYTKVKTLNGKNITAYDDKVPKTNKVYYYKLRVFNKNNGQAGYGDWSKIVKGKALKTPSVKAPVLLINGAIEVSWTKAGGAGGYDVYRRVENGAFQKIAEVNSGSTLSYADSDVKAGVNYYYKVKAKNVYNGVAGASGYSAVKHYYIFYYEIMGETTVSAAQMANCYRASGHSYPAAVYAEKGAGSIEEFARIVIEEAAAEGVRAEVLWGQIILETGWLQFAGSMVGQSQCNFGGLGATDNSGGVYVANYPDVRTGIRAQVQHLKAYASTAPLNQPCVDTRFSLVTRGSAIYVEWLGQQENPLGYGWATGLGYGDKIRRLINQTKSY